MGSSADDNPIGGKASDTKTPDLSTPPATDTPTTATPKAAGTPDSSSPTPTTPPATTTPDPSGTSSAGGGDSGTASNDASDIQQCQSLEQAAINACTPSSNANTNGLGNSNGLTNSCTQTSQLNGIGGTANYNAGNTCYQSYTSCADTCNTLAAKYSGNTNSTLISYANTCSNLSTKANTMATQAQNNNNASSAGAACDNAASSATPSSASPSSNTPSSTAAATNPNDPYGCTTNPTSTACQSCANNPSSTECKALAAAAASDSKVGFQPQSAQANSSGNNVGDLTDQAGSGQTQFGDYKPEKQQATAVPNNSGGGLPGAQGAGTTTGAFGINSPAARAAMASRGGVSTDIDRGFRSGGGYSSDPGGGGSSGGYQVASKALAGRGPASLGGPGLDLKKYLPGGLLDPHRVGGLSSSNEIAGQGADLFKNVSIRFQEKCRLGELIDCH